MALSVKFAGIRDLKIHRDPIPKNILIPASRRPTQRIYWRPVLAMDNAYRHTVWSKPQSPFLRHRPILLPLGVHSPSRWSQGDIPGPPKEVPTFNILIIAVFWAIVTIVLAFLCKGYDLVTQLQAPLQLEASLPYLKIILGYLVLLTVVYSMISTVGAIKYFSRRLGIPNIKVTPRWKFRV